MQPLLTIQNLTISFGQGDTAVQAVSGINFTLAKGETLGIVGESGSGKSVTALSLMGLLPPAAKWDGTIHLGEDLELNNRSGNNWKEVRGKRMAMIFQEPMTSLNPVMKCGDQVAEAIQLHKGSGRKQAKAQVLEWFEKVKLPDPPRIYDAFPHQLSGGQKQRVMIALALSCNPEILIADEPTTALDVTVQHTILELLNELKRELRISVIFITHDLGVMAEVADRVIVMRKGQIVEEAPIKTLFQKPQHPYTKGLLACRPPLDKRLYRLPVIEDFMQEDSNVKPSVHPPKGTPNVEQPPLLKVTSLRTWFGTSSFPWRKKRDPIKAVDDVSLEVFIGETLGLVGESGSGKTTLGRSILRLVEPQSGQVNFEGQEILTADHVTLKALRRKIQIIFQDPVASFNPRMMIGTALMEPMKVHQIGSNDQERRDRAVELLEQVGLNQSHFSRYPHEFSGGQRQRIGIARALAVDPAFIVCDECVSALDVSVQAQVLNLLKNLQEKRGLTYIFISHDLSVIRFMSDRIAVMKEGKILELESADRLYNNPQSPYTKQLLAAVPMGL